MIERRISRTLALTVAISWCVITSGCGTQEEWQYPASLEKVISKADQEVVRRATFAEAALVGDLTMTGANPSSFGFVLRGEYSLRTAAVRLSDAQAGRLSRLLLERKSYQTLAKPCIFQPSVVYRFIVEADTVAFTVCHGCNQLVIEGDRTGRGEVDPRQVGTGGGEFDPIRLELVDMTHELFPNDFQIAQSWRRKHEEKPWRP